jgi:hypothetical protein
VLEAFYTSDLLPSESEERSRRIPARAEGAVEGSEDLTGREKRTFPLHDLKNLGANKMKSSDIDEIDVVDDVLLLCAGDYANSPRNHGYLQNDSCQMCDCADKLSPLSPHTKEACMSSSGINQATPLFSHWANYRPGKDYKKIRSSCCYKIRNIFPR